LGAEVPGVEADAAVEVLGPEGDVVDAHGWVQGGMAKYVRRAHASAGLTSVQLVDSINKITNPTETPMTAFRFDARRRDALRLLTAGAAAAACPALRAQEAFPSRPIRVVVPFAAGGAIDVAVRAMTDRVAQEVRQP